MNVAQIENIYTELNQSQPIVLVLLVAVGLVALYILSQRGQNKTTSNLTETLRDVIKGTNDVNAQQLKIMSELSANIDRATVENLKGHSQLAQSLSNMTTHTDDILKKEMDKTRAVITAQSDKVVSELHTQIDRVIVKVDEVTSEILSIRNTASALRDKLDTLSIPAPKVLVSPVIPQPTD